MGCQAVLVNSAIALSHDPILMAEAFKYAVISGRKAFLAGGMKIEFYAQACTRSQR